MTVCITPPNRAYEVNYQSSFEIRGASPARYPRSTQPHESVYGRWPSNPTSYAIEANIGIVDPDTGVSDDFRIGYAGADTGQRDGTPGGYIWRKVDGSRTDYLGEDVEELFEATESSDQQSYEFVINWQTPLPEAPKDRIEALRVNEVFGSDGGEGVQTEDVDPIAESSDELRLTGGRA